MTDRVDDALATDGEPDAGPQLVEWEDTARRVRRSALVLGGLALVGWAVSGALDGGAWTLRSLGTWAGFAVLAMFVAEVVVVGGSAARGLLRAGERGERLSGGDVGLFPPTRPRTDATTTDDAVTAPDET